MMKINDVLKRQETPLKFTGVSPMSRGNDTPASLPPPHSSQLSQLQSPMDDNMRVEESR